MATQGVNTCVANVRWRPGSDSLFVGLQSDIWDATSQTLTAIEIPVGFDSSTLTFLGGAHILQVASGSDLTASQAVATGHFGAAYAGPQPRDSRYFEDPNHPFASILDELAAEVTLGVPTNGVYALDNILPELSMLKYMRMDGDSVQTTEVIIRVHMKEA